MASIVGVIVALAFHGVEDLLWLFMVALWIVAIAGLAQLRLWVLPAQLEGRELWGGAAPPAATDAERQQAATIIACTFAAADAIYGVVAAVMLGEWIWPLLFGAFALLSLAVTSSYVNTKAEELKRAGPRS